MTNPDIRWQQRFQNYTKAFVQLDDAVMLASKRELSSLEKQGLIQAFEFTYELAWNTLKNYLEWQGISDLIGSRDTIREAFNQGLVSEGQIWMNMLVDRNRTSHTYNEKTAEAIIANICNDYHAQFNALIATLKTKLVDKP